MGVRGHCGRAGGAKGQVKNAQDRRSVTGRGNGDAGPGESAATRGGPVRHRCLRDNGKNSEHRARAATAGLHANERVHGGGGGGGGGARGDGRRDAQREPRARAHLEEALAETGGTFFIPAEYNLAMVHLFSGGEGGGAAGGGGGRRCWGGWGEDWDGEAEERAPAGARAPLPW